MLGAFEIGEFDEVKTVEYIWRFLTEILQIDPERIWSTSFDKDNVSGTTISQSKKLIKYLKTIVPNKLILSDSKTNLWMQGGGIEFKDNIRMSGPQVEFFYEIDRHCEPKAKQSLTTCHAELVSASSSQNKTLKQVQGNKFNPLTNPENFLEISNIVFIKYYVDYSDMKLKRLLNQSTEAVIGLEKIVAVIEPCQNKILHTSYFSPLLSIFPKIVNR